MWFPKCIPKWEINPLFPVYWKLNAVTVKNAYPLHLIPDILNKVSKAKAKYFTKLDVRWGYKNIGSKKEMSGRLPFRQTEAFFEPLVMFFGLTNSPATFQTMMNNIFKELINEGVVTIYMDNILIFSGQTWEQHREIVVWVLKHPP